MSNNLSPIPTESKCTDCKYAMKMRDLTHYHSFLVLGKESVNESTKSLTAFLSLFFILW